MYSADDIAEALRRAVPADQQGAIPALSRILAEAVSKPLSKQEFVARVAAERLDPLLAVLAGQRLAVDGAMLSFGQGSNLGDVTVGNVVGGDLVQLVFNVYPPPSSVPGSGLGAAPSSSTGGHPSATADPHGRADVADQAPTSQRASPGATLPIAEFAPSRRWRMKRVVVGVVAALLGVGGLVYAASIALGLASDGNGDALTPALVGPTLLGGGALYARESYRDDRRIVVFGDRVERHGSGRVSSMLWRDVRRAWKQVTVHQSSSRRVTTVSGFKLELREGIVVEVKLDWDGAQQAHLDELIRHAVSENLLSRYRDSYTAGRQTEFAPSLFLTRQGIQWGKQLIRWDRVERADFERYDVTLYTRDSSPPNTPLKLRLSEATANYFLFTALVNEIVAGRRW
jgi:hypothetical protein